jgi:hypothetical protein
VEVKGGLSDHLLEDVEINPRAGATLQKTSRHQSVLRAPP